MEGLRLPAIIEHPATTVKVGMIYAVAPPYRQSTGGDGQVFGGCFFVNKIASAVDDVLKGHDSLPLNIA